MTHGEPPTAKRICYFIPGPMSRGQMGPAEVQRRREYLQRRAPSGVRIEIRETADGPASIESERDEEAAVEAIVETLPSLAAERLDAVIMGCFGDPAVDRVREAVDAPVIGPAEAAFRSVQGRFAVITVDVGVAAMLERLAREHGCAGRLTDVLSIDVPVLQLRARRALVRDRLLVRGRAALEDGAEGLLLGCMTLGFLGLAAEIAPELQAPVIDPASAALRAAVASVRGRATLAGT